MVEIAALSSSKNFEIIRKLIIYEMKTNKCKTIKLNTQ